jgi:hypothetical protein
VHSPPLSLLRVNALYECQLTKWDRNHIVVLAHASATRLYLRKGKAEERVMKIHDSPNVGSYPQLGLNGSLISLV